MPFNFQDRVAVVTGAGSGIGRATAIAFAGAGAKTVVSDVNEESGQQTVAMIRDKQGIAEFRQCDVSREQEVKALMDFVVNTYGGLNYACNNAGVGQYGQNLLSHTVEEWDRLMDINLKGVWLSMKYEIPHMLKQDVKAIVNIASLTGVLGNQLASLYSATKHGVVGLTKSSSLDFASEGLRINAICPGMTRTGELSRFPDLVAEFEKQIPMGRLAEPENQANAVMLLCSDEASFITGQILPVDGGFSVP
jgi:NAD(P)-dependent dehydrogenase (short-subunit alcohol dehydrogenase family)